MANLLKKHVLGGASWDIANLSYLQNYSIVAQEGNGQGVHFKPDGTKMFTAGNDLDEWALSPAWDVTSASHTATMTTLLLTDLYFKTDGTKVYTLRNNSGWFYEYNLSSAWDVTSVSAIINSYAMGANTTGLYIKSDGTTVWSTNTTGEVVTEWDLSTPWDVSTISSTQTFAATGTGDTGANGISFSDDGTKMFIVYNTLSNIAQFDLSSAWDISTASYTKKTASADSGSKGLFMRTDGLKVYTISPNADVVSEYDMT